MHGCSEWPLAGRGHDREAGAAAGTLVKKARGGKLGYKWGHNNKFVRVVWEKSGAGGAK